ncbi:MAG: ectonucleotide pyrophosphatase/phosphodiesterase [Acidobacteriaceae bacterium]|nr:ectonucleotide pyrophosphatase/phosphodiesterase [Acidobacteriaceae bacterium]
MMRWLGAVLLMAAMSAAAQSTEPVLTADNPANSAVTLQRHYVVLVSLDGFRYDYAREHGAPQLEQMAADGASTPTGMLPSFPSVTFPNHYTLVTGLRPEHHDIVGMEFWDEKRQARYMFSNPQTATDGSWYGGTPLWVVAEKQGVRSACFFWPGSEAKIDGVRPSYYMKFDKEFDDRKRVEQIISWLHLPASERPHFLTLYYSNADDAGHHFGPDSKQTQAAVQHLDAMIGELREKLKATGLPVDLIVTADHGMIQLDPNPVVLDTLVDLKDARVEGSYLYPKSSAEAERIYKGLKAANDPRFQVYRRKKVPASLHFNENAREGDPVIIPTAPYVVLWRMPAHKRNYAGSHGFDPHASPQMKAIFYAEGPDIAAGVALPSFDNVDVYPFIAHLLALKVGHTDGSLKPLEPALKTP